jgi:hypothetical protein
VRRCVSVIFCGSLRITWSTATTEPPGLLAFAESLAQLETRIAAADADGSDVPPEARQMLVKLRELVVALADLGSSFEPRPREVQHERPDTDL